MTTLTFLRSISQGIDFMSSSIYDGFETMDVLSYSGTQLRLQDPEFDDIFTFSGSGLTYSASTGQVTGGTFTGMNASYLGQTFFTWSGLNVSAASMYAYVKADNWTALNAMLFNTGDTYSLTDGVDTVRGFGGNDVMRGFGGADVLLGDLGNDKIYGDLGNDKLYGGAGNDTLIGGLGVDTLSGSTGADTFVFLYNGAAHRDIISDFNAVDDQLQFDNASFTALGTATGALAASKFVAGTAALDSADRFIYQKTTGYLWYDADGSGAGAKVLVADFANGTTLTAADIFII